MVTLLIALHISLLAADRIICDQGLPDGAVLQARAREERLLREPQVATLAFADSDSTIGWYRDGDEIRISVRVSNRSDEVASIPGINWAGVVSLDWSRALAIAAFDDSLVVRPLAGSGPRVPFLLGPLEEHLFTTDVREICDLPPGLGFTIQVQIPGFYSPDILTVPHLDAHSREKR